VYEINSVLMSVQSGEHNSLQYQPEYNRDPDNDSNGSQISIINQ